MILAIDIGNTYVKYKAWSGNEVLFAGKVEPAKIKTIVDDLQGRLPARIVVASVGSPAVGAAIQQLFPEVELSYIHSTAHCLGVVNGYEQPDKLGVDRWLAVIEAYHDSGKKACAVFDLGTALTLDVVNAAGVHEGGYIAPGLSMMRDALLKSTQKVRFESKHVVGLGYGKNTADAVEKGTFSLVLAWMEFEIQVFRSAYPQGLVYLTGGLAPVIRPFLPESVRCHEDIILDALKRIAAS